MTENLTVEQTAIRRGAEDLLRVLDAVVPPNVAHYAVEDARVVLATLVRKAATVRTVTPEGQPSDAELVAQHHAHVEASMDTGDLIAAAVEQGTAAFWQAVAAVFPQATTGDLPPEAVTSFGYAADAAVQTWATGNAGY